MSKNILPELISVSRNCGATAQLNKIIEEKFNDADIELLHRWLQIVSDEKQIAIKSDQRKFRHF